MFQKINLIIYLRNKFLIPKPMLSNNGPVIRLKLLR